MLGYIIKNQLCIELSVMKQKLLLFSIERIIKIHIFVLKIYWICLSDNSNLVISTCISVISMSVGELNFKNKNVFKVEKPEHA